MAYRLTRQAEIDVIQIYVQGARDFGAAQAERITTSLKAPSPASRRFHR